MSQPNLVQWFARVAPLTLVTQLAGCPEFMLQDDEAYVLVYATHHATPQNGIFPDRGAEDSPRVFENDTGWTITLGESYVVTSNVTLAACDGMTYPVDMANGPLAESLREADLETSKVAGSHLATDEYCQLIVHYAPYVFPETPVADAPPPNLAGHTIFLSGNARNAEGVSVPFELYSDESVQAVIDLSTAGRNGGPFEVSGSPLPIDLTIAKTYDRFFDGIDFNDWSADEVEARLASILVRETRKHN